MTVILESRAALSRAECIGEAKRIVVKVGSAVIAGRGRLRPKVIADLVHDVTVLAHRGHEIVMVVSGAVAAGFADLGLDASPTGVVQRQAAASIGQYKLMTTFAKAFGRARIRVAQLLLMHDDIEDRRRFISARHTINELLARGVIPIINENDPLATDEAKIGDNDHLAALVTNLASAGLLVILSTVEGVYERGDPGSVIDRVEVGSSIDRHITPATSESGVGGMRAKVSAAHLASRWGVPTVIACGTRAGLLPRVVRGESVGTLFVPRRVPLSARKRWIVIRTRSHGSIAVDDGAKRAILDRGASLLPAGIVDVTGRFDMGDRVDIRDATGATFAVGLVSYGANEIRRMKGRRQREFKSVLGYEYVSEIVDRDDLVVTMNTECRMMNDE